MSLRHPCAAVLASTLLAVVACGSSADDPAAADTADASPGTGSDDFGGDGGPSATSDGGEQCAATTAAIAKPQVDIIFVIDDSGSMGEEMDQIKTNINSFAQKIGGVGLDYHVVFITRKGTTKSTICVPQPLAAASCADNLPTFAHIDQDVQSTNSLSLVLSTYDSPTKAWNKHLRLEATKIFVEVTDDRSAMTATAFDTQLLAKLPAGMFGTTQARKYVFHSIVSKPFAEPVGSTKKCSTAAGASVDYQQLSQLTGGIIDEVCKTDYSGVLDNIAAKVVEKVACELPYPTADAADPTKFVVRFTSASGTASNLQQVTDPSKCAAVPDGWFYDDNTKPTRIILCPTMCKTANASTGAKLEALVGCKAPTPS